MKTSHKEFAKQTRWTDYLDDPAYDIGCEWVVSNITRIRSLVPDTTIDAEGFVVNGESKSRLFALRQIAARQDSSIHGLSGPVVGFIDVAIIEETTRERLAGASESEITWAVAVFVRPTISHLGGFLREIEQVRKGYIKDNRATVLRGYYESVVLPDEMSIVIVSRDAGYRDEITSQGYIFHSWV